MKTKILSCFAALLLTSTSAFAQSAAKADVNDDGLVDVADVVSVAAIKKAGAAIPITSIKLASIADVYTDVETQLSLIILPTYATDKAITWTSSNSSVATVSQAGVVKGVGEGGATITATTSNGKKATCEVTVHLTEYYWYVGQTQPISQSSVTPQNSETITNNNWHTINVNNTYSFSNPIYNSESNPISGDSNTYWYVALPADKSYGIYDSDDVNDINVGNWTEQSPITVSNVNYKVYKKVSGSRKFAAYWIH